MQLLVISNKVTANDLVFKLTTQFLVFLYDVPLTDTLYRMN